MTLISDSVTHSAIMARGGAVEYHPNPVGFKQRQLSVINWQSREELRGPNFTFGQICTTLQCCRREDALLLTLHFYSSFMSWRQLLCSALTWTPIMSSEKTEILGACSAFLWPCTGSSTRTKSCEWCLQMFTSVELSELLGAPERTGSFNKQV